MSNNTRRLAKYLGSGKGGVPAWVELLQTTTLPKDGSSSCFYPYADDYYAYEAIRRVSCGNCITHGTDQYHHYHGDLTQLANWQQLKKEYGRVDYVISGDVPLPMLDYVLAYGWKLARRGVLLGGITDWVEQSKVVAKLPTPTCHYLDTSGYTRYWSHQLFYYWGHES